MESLPPGGTPTIVEEGQLLSRETEVVTRAMGMTQTVTGRQSLEVGSQRPLPAMGTIDSLAMQRRVIALAMTTQACSRVERKLGSLEPQGQFLDDQKAATFSLEEFSKGIKGAYTGAAA